MINVQNGRPDRVTHFFETLAAELQSQPEWREWFGKVLVILFISVTTFFPFLIKIKMLLEKPCKKKMKM